jgi:hypothetical protein
VDWKLLIIPLIPLAVWIIATIFQSLGEQQEKEKEQERRRTPRPDGMPRGDPKPTAARRPGSDLDRFLQEARQRRTVSRAGRTELDRPPLRQEAPPPVVDVPVAVPVEVARPIPRPEPPPAPVAEPPRRVAPIATPAPPPPPEPAPPPRPVVVSPTTAVPVSPVVARLRALLRDRTSLQTAIALREVLDRPKCQRGGRGV